MEVPIEFRSAVRLQDGGQVVLEALRRTTQLGLSQGGRHELPARAAYSIGDVLSGSGREDSGRP